AGLRDRLGAAGRERVLQHFTWAKAAEGTVARYREAIAAGRHPRATAADTAPATPVRSTTPPVTAPASPLVEGADTESRATC
ncbi:glycosyltransferase, partial [Streptomyces viridochromogenes]|uniref:glycosyltransferase n=2 Tax=Streptomyces TaxID=1883 RepID=UPI00117EF1DE